MCPSLDTASMHLQWWLFCILARQGGKGVCIDPHFQCLCTYPPLSACRVTVVYSSIPLHASNKVCCAPSRHSSQTLKHCFLTSCSLYINTYSTRCCCTWGYKCNTFTDIYAVCVCWFSLLNDIIFWKYCLHVWLHYCWCYIQSKPHSG